MAHETNGQLGRIRIVTTERGKRAVGGNGTELARADRVTGALGRHYPGRNLYRVTKERIEDLTGGSKQSERIRGNTPAEAVRKALR